MVRLGCLGPGPGLQAGDFLFFVFRVNLRGVPPHLSRTRLQAGKKKKEGHISVLYLLGSLCLRPGCRPGKKSLKVIHNSVVSLLASLGPGCRPGFFFSFLFFFF